MKNLLVSLAIGEKYINEYNNLFFKSQLNYARKHSYDFKLVKERPDGTINHPDTISFDKALVFSQDWVMDYDNVIFIDADIFINPNSPPIHKEIADTNKIMVVDEYSQPTQHERINVQKKMGWETSAVDYYDLAGFSIRTNKMINSGVIMMNPNLHGKFMKSIHFKYHLRSINHPRGFHFEQSAIGYEIQKENLADYLDNKFNAVWGIYKISDPAMSLKDFAEKNYFIHLAGKVDFDKVSELNLLFNLN
jgi:hypothetical protein